MLIHPWDKPEEETWRAWLAPRTFGTLAANGPDGGPPVLVPTHFVHLGGDEFFLHLARPNPFWDAVAANPKVTLAVTDDYAFVPGTWRATPDMDPDHGVPTSYYASVHLIGTATIVDDPQEKAELINRQFAHFQPDSVNTPIVPGQPPFGKMLSAIRGLRVRIEEVRAKAKYDDHKDAELVERVRKGLGERGEGMDATVAARLAR